jgi:triosephosphate isomerase
MTPDTQVGAGAPRGTGDSRRPLIVGNWKLWGTRVQAAGYCERLLELLPDEGRRPADAGIAAPFTALDVCVVQLRDSGVGVYAQNMHQEQSGAFTGEVSAEMLTELSVDGVVLGHSERRQYSCETDRALQDKLPAALEAGLQPILCVGESDEERERDETQRKLRTQVQEAIEKVPEDRLAEVVIAYEPIWAIGTGKVATPEIAQEAIAFIRALVGDRSKEAAQSARILYGGSVKPDNAAEILAQPDVDGALVGGASLEPEGFARIVAAAAP